MRNAEFDFCILIPCYNNTAGLLKSIQSIQYKKGAYLVLVIDDGSTQPITSNLPEQYQADHSIKILTLSTNQGIASALNHGLKWIKEQANTNYIARLDCGDICSPFRFEKQVEFLENHPLIALVGTWCSFTNYREGFSYNYVTAIKHDDIQREMHFKNVFIHPTVMFRCEILEENIYYPTEFKHAEDYAFFWRILKKFQVAVIPENLVTCELNSHSISAINRKKQLKDRKLILQQYGTHKLLKTLGLLRLSLLSVIPASILLKLKKVA